MFPEPCKQCLAVISFILNEPLPESSQILFFFHINEIKKFKKDQSKVKNEIKKIMACLHSNLVFKQPIS